jgi:hypothetical protein
MSKRMSVLLMLACLPFAAGAAEPAPAETSATETTAAETAAKPDTADNAKKPAPCEKVTGSRVRPSSRDCASTKPFRTYTADDLERTGEMNMSDALRKLDPIFR